MKSIEPPFERSLTTDKNTDAPELKTLIEIEANSTNQTPRMVNERHSIGGSPLPQLSKNNNLVETTSGRMLKQLSKEMHNNHVSGSMVSNNQLQASVLSVRTAASNGLTTKSIEDLYIDDDFGGVGLAANMKLVTTSIDSLDIDF